MKSFNPDVIFWGGLDQQAAILPLIGRLFATNRKEVHESDIVLTITPHIVRVLDLTEADLRPFRLGRDAASYRRLFGPMEQRFDRISEEFLQPIAHLPRHPVALARLGGYAPLPATALARPTAGTTGGHVASLYVTWGQKRADEFFTALHGNGALLVGGNSIVAESVARGDVLAGLCDNDDAASAASDVGPINIDLPDQSDGQMGTLAMPCTAALVAGAPHPEAAKRLIDFLLSREVDQALLAGREPLVGHAAEPVHDREAVAILDLHVAAVRLHLTARVADHRVHRGVERGPIVRFVGGLKTLRERLEPRLRRVDGPCGFAADDGQ